MRRRSVGAAIAFAALVAAAAAAPWLAPADPHFQHLEKRLAPPSLAHPLGLDELGRDILSRLLWGGRVSLTVALAVVSLAVSVGTAIGALAGFAGGRVDAFFMRLADVFLAFPGVLLAVALVAVLGPALENLILALSAIGWVGYARLVRGQVQSLARLPFVAAARASGLSRQRVVLCHVLPHVVPTLAVEASLGMAGAILAEAGLSFLGLGVPPPQPTWGAMINGGRPHLLDAPHVSLVPGLAILLTVLVLNLLGEGLAEELAPYDRRG
jgi:peptide/nickel transport system permease protein